MSSHVVDHPTLRAIAAAALLLASTACGATPDANAVTSETTTAAEPAADAATPATPPTAKATPPSADTNQSGDDVAPGEVSGTEARPSGWRANGR